MKLLPSIILLGSLIPFVAAHFKLVYPDSRERIIDTMSVYPCGSSPPTGERTQVSLPDGSFPVALEMGHSQTAVEMLLALGTNPGENFNITLVHTFGVTGLGAFCLPHVSFSPSVLGTNATDGMNATLQVQSNGHPSGGLYTCADIQFSASASYSQPSSCKNNTGISAVSFPEKLHANQSTGTGEPQSKSSGGGHHGSQSTSTAGAVPLQTAAWGMLGAAVAGGVAVL